MSKTQARTSPNPEDRVLPFGKDIEVFYDGGCPLCRREIAMLRRLDKLKRIRFTDIQAPEFDAAEIGLTHEQLMAEIHGRLPDGRIIRGVEVFRQLYSAVGYCWASNLTRLPIIRSLCDWGYRVFARNRLRWTGRCSNGSCAVTNSQERKPGQ